MTHSNYIKNLLLLLLIASLASNTSCKKKTCPAYDENKKEEYNLKGTRKKAKLF